jgi:hypothetical protein
MVKFCLVFVILVGTSLALDSSWDGITGADKTIPPDGLFSPPPPVGTIPAPDGAPRGLTFDGTNLWCANSGDGNSQYGVKIYKMDPYTGAVIASYDPPGNGACGLAFNGTEIIFTSYGDNTIWFKDPGTFATVRTIPNNISFAFDLGFDGTHIWGCEGNSTNIHKVDPATGAILETVVATYSSANVRPFGLACLPGELWTSDGNYGSNLVNQYDYGSAAWVEQWNADPTTYPCGIAYDPPTGHIWVSCWDMDSIYIFAGPTAVDEDDVTPQDSRNLSVSSGMTDGPVTIYYTLPYDGHVHLNLYDMSGRLVEHLKEGEAIAGSYAMDLDLSDLRGGVYFVTLRTEDSSFSGKIVLMK